MFRLTFPLVDRSADGDERLRELVDPALADGRITAAFSDSKSVEVYVDAAQVGDVRDLAARLARSMRVDEYEITPVDAMRIGAPVQSPAVVRGRARPVAVTRARLADDGRTMSLQARHRPHERVTSVDLDQDEDAVRVRISAATADDPRRHYASLAVAFTWVEVTLEEPLANRPLLVAESELGPGTTAVRVERADTHVIDAADGTEVVLVDPSGQGRPVPLM